jgi:beta-glucosidase
MSLRILLALVLLMACPQTPLPVPAAQDPDSQAFLDRLLTGPVPVRRADAQRIRDLVVRMTLQEKVGQMTQLEIGMVTDGRDLAIRINQEKLRKAVADYGVGSILNVKDQALPVAKWREILAAIQDAAARTRLKIPVLYGLDTIHGANYVQDATLFPQPLGMAATWNPQLVLEGSRIAAAETRAAGIPWTFSPVLDIGRQPLWPRLYETYGEDPYLASVMGAATIRGYQGADPSADTQVGATLKHYIGYSLPTTGHDRTPALIPEITLREYFLPSFAAGVKAGAVSVMVNSGDVNGVPGHENAHLLKDVLRGELGFDGLVVSDWEDIKKLVTIHHTAANEKDATRKAILAGIDMSMVPGDYSFSDLLVRLVNEHAIPMARIDEAVTRVLTLKARLGLFDDPLRGTRAATEVGSSASRQAALHAARESLILLKNDAGALPLGANARLLVTGPTADSLPALDNGWTITWQGNKTAAYPADRLTVRRALEKRFGAGQVTWIEGATYDTDKDTVAAVAAATSVDAIVLCLGEMSYAETPGNIDDLSLPDAQIRLAQALAAAGKPIILVLIEGRPRIVCRVVDRMNAVLLALNPGHEGGTAIADVLAGDVNPSGRLPITYPRYPNALRTYDHKAFEEQDTGFGLTAFTPQFEFGSGLSYTTFEYSGLTVRPATIGAADPVDVSVTVRNTGSRAGSEVVPLFISAQVASVTPPVKRLRRFIKITLQPGESRQIHFRLTRDDVSFVGANNRRVTEPGTFTALVGPLKQPLEVR